MVRKTGEVITGTWTCMGLLFWRYIQFNDQHRFQFYALGAPQRHGQNLYRLNVASLDQDFAKTLGGFSDIDLSEVPEVVEIVVVQVALLVVKQLLC